MGSSDVGICLCSDVILWSSVSHYSDSFLHFPPLALVIMQQVRQTATQPFLQSVPSDQCDTNQVDTIPVWGVRTEEEHKQFSEQSEARPGRTISLSLLSHLTSPCQTDRIITQQIITPVFSKVYVLSRCQLCHLPECWERKCSIHLYSQVSRGIKLITWQPSKS